MSIPKPTLILTILLFSNIDLNGQPKESKVDYSGFLDIGKELADYRISRLIDMETFNAYSQEENTIVLDTRSKTAFDAIHIEGAVHLNFSDFTKKALQKAIPDKKTRILIYCNNNFRSTRDALLDKMAPLALNIPTFINLYGYGYKNIYELNDYLEENDKRVRFKTNKI